MQLLVLMKIAYFYNNSGGSKKWQKRPWTYHSILEQILFFANYSILGLI